MDKVYQNVDEWIFAQGLEHRDTTWARQAWTEAMRLCRVQQKILQTEIDTLKEEIGYLQEVVAKEMK